MLVLLFVVVRLFVFIVCCDFSLLLAGFCLFSWLTCYWCVLFVLFGLRMCLLVCLIGLCLVVY